MVRNKLGFHWWLAKIKGLRCHIGSGRSTYQVCSLPPFSSSLLGTHPHPYSVHTVADLFFDSIVKLHGPPSVIVSDRDRIFTSKLWTELFGALQTSLHFSTAYYPESDGQTEHVNQCPEQYLRCMAFKEPKKWSQWLPAAELWYNCSYHTSIKMLPFEALYEYPPPFDPRNFGALQHIWRSPGDTHREGSHDQNSLAEPSTSPATNEKFADQNRTEREFAKCDVVYLQMQPYRETAPGLRNSLKLTSKWYGPFKITKKAGKVAYQLQLPAGTQLHNVFHVNQLKKHLGNLLFQMQDCLYW